MKKAKRILAAVLAVLMLCGSLTAFAADGNFKNEFQSQGFNVRKVSHPDRGSGEVDGILPFDVMGEDVNRYQSYSWSMAEYGDSIYIGTCWNPIAGIFFRNVRDNLTPVFVKDGMTQAEARAKASKAATAFVNVLYGGNMADGANAQSGTPCIIRVNKKTDEASLVYKETEASQFVNWNGYRTAIVFNNKLYFVCAGFPTSRLLQVDPEKGTAEIVLQRTAEKPMFSSGIRGLDIFNGQLIVSLATDGADPDNFHPASTFPPAMQEAIKAMAKKDTRYTDPDWGMEGVRILSTTDPSDPKAWKVIANQETFDDLPACWVRDSINGGGIWNIQPYNGDLYALMVTGKTDPVTMVNNKRGFAMYKGHQDGDNWTWTPVIGDTSKGAKYPFGMGIDAPCAGNIIEFNGYLYIGGYNDPMLDIAAIPNNKDLSKLYYDLKNPTHLYRMDKNGDIEELVDDGFGDPCNQYVWNMTGYNGKLIVGTYDTSTLCSAFTQLTDGSILKLSPEEFKSRLNYLKEAIEILTDSKAAKSAYAADLDVASASVKSIERTVDGKKLFNNNKKDLVEQLTALQKIYDKVIRTALIIKGEDALAAQIDAFFADKSTWNVAYYLVINDIMSKSQKGFDLMVSEDGVNFEAITRDGFGDPYNHGAKGLLATDSGFYVGTANPFWGTQLWKLTEIDTPATAPESNPFIEIVREAFGRILGMFGSVFG